MRFTDEMHARQSIRALCALETEDPNSDDEDEIIEKPKKKFHKTPSEAFRDGEKITLLRVLEKIDQVERKRYKEGLDEIHFTFGVLNCLAVAFAFGYCPEHFWLIFLVESFYFLPNKFMYNWRARPLCQVYYLLDFCWMMNFMGVFLLILFGMEYGNNIPIISYLSSTVSPDIRKQVFLAVFGIACGPLLGATATLPFVSIVFHDRNAMTNTFIHIFPPLLAYTLRWHGKEIAKAWPGLFQFDYLDDLVFFPSAQNGGTLFGAVLSNTAFVYILWFVPYISWMFLIGLDLPRKNNKIKEGETTQLQYDTVFHFWMRSGGCLAFGKYIWKRPKEKSQTQIQNNDFEMRDFILYMTMHVLSCALAVLLAYACFASKMMHRLLLCGVTYICVYRGAKRYTYYTTKMHSKTLRKEFNIS